MERIEWKNDGAALQINCNLGICILWDLLYRICNPLVIDRQVCQRDCKSTGAVEKEDIHF